MTIKNGEKILYFEGAGMNFKNHDQSDVGNYRIRTALKNIRGEKIYIELGRAYRRNEKGKVTSDWALWIDFLFYVSNDPTFDHCNYSQIKFDRKELLQLDYKKKDILTWINANLNCDFEDMIVTPTDYRVHGTKHGTYNIMNDFYHYTNILKAPNEHGKQEQLIINHLTQCYRLSEVTDTYGDIVSDKDFERTLERVKKSNYDAILH